MNEYESLSHTTWDCKYHVVFIPKCRRKTLYQELRRRHLGEVFATSETVQRTMAAKLPPLHQAGCANLLHPALRLA